MLNKAKETRVLVLRPELLRQCDLVVPCGTSIVLTVSEPLEALDLIFPQEVDPETQLQETKRQRLERHWSELEMRLAFFTDVKTWQ